MRLIGKKARLFLLLTRMFRKKSSQKRDSLTKYIKAISGPPRILLCCWGALGDVVLASSVISKLRAKYPDCTLGFLVDGSSSCVIQTLDPSVHIHEVPHWKFGKKGAISMLGSWIYHSLFVYPGKILELKRQRYDISIELYLFFPTAVPLVFRAGIPRLLGFMSGGYEDLLTDPVPLPTSLQYLPILYETLLEQMGISAMSWTEPGASQAKQGRVVLHVGTSDPRKEWPPAHWQKIARELRTRGYSLVFTGRGDREKRLIQESFCTSEGLLGEDFCDRLSFSAFANTIKTAKGLISVDSVSVHLATLFSTPFVALYLYNESLPLWVPKNVDCSFQILAKQEVEPEEVLQAWGRLHI